MTLADQCRKEWVDIPTTFGPGFYAGARTAFHIRWTISQAALHNWTCLVEQGCYHQGYPPSAGTHDYDEVLDLKLVDSRGVMVPGPQQIHFFRFETYWWGWWRTPDLGFPYHFHGVSSRPHHCHIGDFVPGQLVDWKNKALGLAGMHTPGSDHTAYPRTWKTRYFPYEKILEDDMPFTDWPKKDQDALAQAVTDRVLTAQMNLADKGGDAMFQGMSMRECLKGIYKAVTKK